MSGMVSVSHHAEQRWLQRGSAHTVSTWQAWYHGYEVAVPSADCDRARFADVPAAEAAVIFLVRNGCIVTALPAEDRHIEFESATPDLVCRRCGNERSDAEVADCCRECAASDWRLAACAGDIDG